MTRPIRRGRRMDESVKEEKRERIDWIRKGKYR